MLSEQAVREETTSRLMEALTQDQFILYGQPIVPLDASRKRSGYLEVLIRYAEEERNYLPPGGFLEVLDSLNLMSLLDRWVIHRVVHSLVSLHTARKSWNVPRYSVNLSVDSLYEHEFCRLIGEYFYKHQLPPGKLRFEVSESDAQVHAAELAKMTSALRPIGCRFTLTSYTGTLVSPSSLKPLGVDTVKMEVQNLADISFDKSASPKGTALCLVCKKLGIRTIAEMVERPETIDQITKLGIDYAQGFGIARPAPLQSMMAALN